MPNSPRLPIFLRRFLVAEVTRLHHPRLGIPKVESTTSDGGSELGPGVPKKDENGGSSGSF